MAPVGFEKTSVPELYEKDSYGHSVQLDGNLVVTETDPENNRIEVSQGRLRQPTAYYRPQRAVALREEQRRRTISVEGINNFEKLEEGSVLSSLKGQVRQNRYDNPAVELQSLRNTGQNAFRQSELPAQSDNLRVATFNLESYGVRGRSDAKTPSKTDKLASAVEKANPDILAVQEVANRFGEQSPMSRITDAISSQGNGSYDYVKPPSGDRLGNQPIAVGIAYKPSEVSPVGEAETIEGEAFRGLSRKPLVQKFKDNESGETFTVINVHLKSKRGSGKYPSNIQGGFNYERLQAIGSVIDRIKESGGNAVVLGDFNAYRKEDPLVALESSGMLNISELLGERPNTYTFRGKAGSLDHVFTNPELAKTTDDVGAIASGGSDHKLLWTDFSLGESSFGRRLQTMLNQWSNRQDAVSELYREAQHPTVDIVRSTRATPKYKRSQVDESLELVRPPSELPSAFYDQFRSAETLPKVQIFQNEALNEDLNRMPFRERINRLLLQNSPIPLRDPVIKSDETFLEGGFATVGHLIDRAMGHHYHQQQKRQAQGYYTATLYQATKRLYDPKETKQGPFESLLGGIAQTVSSVSAAFLSYGLFRGTSLLSAHMEDELNRQFQQGTGQYRTGYQGRYQSVQGAREATDQTMRFVRQAYIGSEGLEGYRSLRATQLPSKAALAKYQGYFRKFQSFLMDTVLGGILETISADREQSRTAVREISEEIGKVPTIVDEGQGGIRISNIGSGRMQSLAQRWENISRQVPANLLQWFPAMRQSPQVDLTREASMSDLVGQNLQDMLSTYEQVFKMLGSFVANPRQWTREISTIYQRSGQIEREERQLIQDVAQSSQTAQTADNSVRNAGRDPSEVVEMASRRARLNERINYYESYVQPPNSKGPDIRGQSQKELFGIPIRKARRGMLGVSAVFGADYLTSFAIAGDGGLSLINYLLNPEARKARRAETDLPPVVTASAGVGGALLAGWTFPQFKTRGDIELDFQLPERDSNAVDALRQREYGPNQIDNDQLQDELRKERTFLRTQLNMSERRYQSHGEHALPKDQRRQFQGRVQGIDTYLGATPQEQQGYRTLAESFDPRQAPSQASYSRVARFNKVSAAIGFAVATTGARLTSAAVATGINLFHDSGYPTEDMSYLGAQRIDTKLPDRPLSRDEKANYIAARDYKSSLLKRSESQYRNEFTLTPQFTTPLFQLSWVERTDPSSGTKNYTFGFQLFPLLGGGITPELPVAFRLFGRPESRRKDIDSKEEWAESVAYRAATFPSELLTGVSDSGFEKLAMSVGAYGVAGAIANRVTPRGVKTSLPGRGVRTVSRGLIDFGSSVMATPAMMLDSAKVGFERVLHESAKNARDGQPVLHRAQQAITNRVFKAGRDVNRNRSARWRGIAPYALAYTASLAYIDRQMGSTAPGYSGTYVREEANKWDRTGAALGLAAAYGGVMSGGSYGYNPFAESEMVARDAYQRRLETGENAERGFKRTIKGTQPDQPIGASSGRRPTGADYNARFIGKAQTLATRAYGLYLTGQLVGKGLEAMGFKEPLFGDRETGFFRGLIVGTAQVLTGGYEQPEHPAGGNPLPKVSPQSDVKQMLAEAGYFEQGLLSETINLLNPLSFLSDSGAYADDPNVFFNFFATGQSVRDDISTSGYTQFQGSNVDLSMTTRSLSTRGLEDAEKEALKRIIAGAGEGKVSPQELVNTLRSLSPRPSRMDYTATKSSELAQTSSFAMSQALAVREFYAQNLSRKRPSTLALEHSLYLNRAGLGKTKDARLDSKALFSRFFSNFDYRSLTIGGETIPFDTGNFAQELKQSLIDNRRSGYYTQVEGIFQSLSQWAMTVGGASGATKFIPGSEFLHSDESQEAVNLQSNAFDFAKIGFGALTLGAVGYAGAMTVGRFAATLASVQERNLAEGVQRQIETIAQRVESINVNNLQQVKYHFDTNRSQGSVFIQHREDELRRIPGLSNQSPVGDYGRHVAERFEALYKGRLIPTLAQEIRGAAFTGSEAADLGKPYMSQVREIFESYDKGAISSDEMSRQIRGVLDSGEGYEQRVSRRISEILEETIDISSTQSVKLFTALTGLSGREATRDQVYDWVKSIFRHSDAGGDFTAQIQQTLEQASKEGVTPEMAMQRVKLDIASRLDRTAQLIPSDKPEPGPVEDFDEARAVGERARQVRYRRQQAMTPEPKAELGARDIPRAIGGAVDLFGKASMIQEGYGVIEGASLYADATASGDPIQARQSSKLFWGEAGILGMQSFLVKGFSGRMGLGTAGLIAAGTTAAYSSLSQHSEALQTAESKAYNFFSENLSAIPKAIGTGVNWFAEALNVLPGVEDFNLFKDVTGPLIRRGARALRQTDNQFLSLLGGVVLPRSTVLRTGMQSERKQTAYGYQRHFYGSVEAEWQRIARRRRRRSSQYGRPVDVIHSGLYGQKTTKLGKARKAVRYGGGKRVLDEFSFRANYQISQTLQLALERRQRRSDLYAQGYVYRMNEVDKTSWRSPVASSIAARAQSISAARDRGLFFVSALQDIKAGIGKSVVRPLLQEADNSYRKASYRGVVYYNTRYREKAIQDIKNLGGTLDIQPSRVGPVKAPQADWGSDVTKEVPKRIRQILRNASSVRDVVPTTAAIVKGALRDKTQRARRNARSWGANQFDGIATPPIFAKIGRAFGKRAPILRRSPQAGLYQLRKANFIQARQGNLPPLVGGLQDPEFLQAAFSDSRVRQGRATSRLFGSGLRGLLSAGVFLTRLGAETISKGLGGLGRSVPGATLRAGAYAFFSSLNLGGRLAAMGVTIAGGMVSNPLVGEIGAGILSAVDLATTGGSITSTAAGAYSLFQGSRLAFPNPKTGFRNAMGSLEQTLRVVAGQASMLPPLSVRQAISRRMPGGRAVSPNEIPVSAEDATRYRKGLFKSVKDRYSRSLPISPEFPYSQTSNVSALYGEVISPNNTFSAQPIDGQDTRSFSDSLGDLLKQGRDFIDRSRTAQYKGPPQAEGKLGQIGRAVSHRASQTSSAISQVGRRVPGVMRSLAPDVASFALDAYFINRSYRKIEDLQKGRDYQARYEQAYAEYYGNIGSTISGVGALAIASAPFTGGLSLLPALGISIVGGIAGGIVGAEYGKQRGADVYHGEDRQGQEWWAGTIAKSVAAVPILSTAYKLFRDRNRQGTQSDHSQAGDEGSSGSRRSPSPEPPGLSSGGTADATRRSLPTARQAEQRAVDRMRQQEADRLSRSSSGKAQRRVASPVEASVDKSPEKPKSANDSKIQATESESAFAEDSRRSATSTRSDDANIASDKSQFSAPTESSDTSITTDSGQSGFRGDRPAGSKNSIGSNQTRLSLSSGSNVPRGMLEELVKNQIASRRRDLSDSNISATPEPKPPRTGASDSSISADPRPTSFPQPRGPAKRSASVDDSRITSRVSNNQTESLTVTEWISPSKYKYGPKGDIELAGFETFNDMPYKGVPEANDVISKLLRESVGYGNLRSRFNAPNQEPLAFAKQFQNGGFLAIGENMRDNKGKAISMFRYFYAKGPNAVESIYNQLKSEGRLSLGDPIQNQGGEFEAFGSTIEAESPGPRYQSSEVGLDEAIRQAKGNASGGEFSFTFNLAEHGFQAPNVDQFLGSNTMYFVPEIVQENAGRYRPGLENGNQGSSRRKRGGRRLNAMFSPFPDWVDDIGSDDSILNKAGRMLSRGGQNVAKRARAQGKQVMQKGRKAIGNIGMPGVMKGLNALGTVGDIAELGFAAYGAYEVQQGVQEQNRKRAVKGGATIGGAVGGFAAGGIATAIAVGVAIALALPALAIGGLALGAGLAVGAIGSYFGSKFGGEAAGSYYDRQMAHEDVASIRQRQDQSRPSIREFAESVTASFTEGFSLAVGGGVEADRQIASEGGFFSTLGGMIGNVWQATKAAAQATVSGVSKVADLVSSTVSAGVGSTSKAGRRLGKTIKQTGQAIENWVNPSVTGERPTGREAKVSSLNEPFYQQQLNEAGVDATVTSGYGRRADPMTGRPEQHEGLDVVAPKGSKFYNPYERGRVQVADRVSGYGNAVYVKQLNEKGKPTGRRIMAGHLRSINVERGQTVSGGKALGVQGSTGHSTGDHFHIEVQKRQDGQWQDVAPSDREIIASLSGKKVVSTGSVEGKGRIDLGEDPDVSKKGLSTLKNFEGLRLNSYQDSAGVWTVGYGHTDTAKPGMSISRSRAKELLKRDLQRFEEAVAKKVDVPLSQSQFDALVSFTYNVGIGALSRSTLLEKLNRGNYEGAQKEFKKWTHAGGRELEGLVKRRKAEARLFGSEPPKEAQASDRQSSDRQVSADKGQVVFVVGHSSDRDTGAVNPATGKREEDVTPDLVKEINRLADEYGYGSAVRIASGNEKNVGESKVDKQTSSGKSFTSAAAYERQGIEYYGLHFNAVGNEEQGGRRPGIITGTERTQADRNLGSLFSMFPKNTSDFYVTRNEGSIIELGAADSPLVNTLAGAKGEESKRKAQRQVALRILRRTLKGKGYDVSNLPEPKKTEQPFQAYLKSPEKSSIDASKVEFSDSQELSKTIEAQEANQDKQLQFDSADVAIAPDPEGNRKNKATEEQNKQVEEEIKKEEEKAKLQIELAQASPDIPHSVEPAYSQVLDQWLEGPIASTDTESRNYRKAGNTKVTKKDNGNKEVNVEVEESQEAVELATASADEFSFTEGNSPVEQMVARS
ncbi:MAG: hypothetical protein BRC33_01555 [Cyanobacteria bacterium SW_9_44_58]|nr:MAG: hypothetical protein BRC33_01555 [Cyanobacteria bacterium SW_9_44_58]